MRDRKHILYALFIGLVTGIPFIYFQVKGIFGGDSGDLVTAGAVFGVPHPPGYPLYTLLIWLAAHIPLYTIAWRATLLSSFPHIAVLIMVFLLVYRITKRYMPATFAVAALFGNYVFFLYSVTPEVFALFNFFIVLLLSLAVLWMQKKQIIYLYLWCFFFGLSLTHHHVILFFLPGFAYLFWTQRTSLPKKMYPYVLGSIFTGLGLLPYLYVSIAARGTAMINWNNAQTLPNLIRLITRADYGTFQSGAMFGAYLIQRVLQIKMYASLVVLDLRLIGIVLALAGIIWLWKKQKYLAKYFIFSLLIIGPFFFFYASFPIANRFTLGTYERFLLASYMLWYPLIGIGALALQQWTTDWMSKKLSERVRSVWSITFTLLLFAYPLVATSVTVWRFIGIQNDQTANNLGRDILASVAPNSILLLGRDTPLFITQYVRYALKERPDVILLHGTRLGVSEYPEIMHKAYPQLTLPDKNEKDYTLAFIQANRNRYRIYTNVLSKTDAGWVWVSHGLVYQLTLDTELGTMESIMETNTRLWQSYHQPQIGILSRYNHLMLADIRDVYGLSRLEYGKVLLRANKTEEAKEQFTQVLSYGGDNQVSEAHVYIGLSSLFLKQCDAALSSFAKARVMSLSENVDILLYEATTYRDCVGDTKKADELFSAYARVHQSKETPLGPQ